MPKVELEISENEKRIEARLTDFDLDLVNKMKSVPGWKFTNKERAEDGRPYWYWVADMVTARRLRATLGDALVLGPRITRWGYTATSRSEKLIGLALAENAELERLPEVLPELYEAVFLGPLGQFMSLDEKEIAWDKGEGSFQTADVKFLSEALNPLNGNHPGLGKTIETIAAIHEAGRDAGYHLVIAPKSSLETVWAKELLEWQYHTVITCATDNPDQRMEICNIALDYYEREEPFWFICNPQMVQYRGIYEQDEFEPKKKILRDVESPFPPLHQITWTTVILDEIHKAGFRNLNSLMAQGIFGLKETHRMALSGTPVGGRVENLWNILHWLNPKIFGSKWRFAEQFLEIHEKEYHVRGGGGRTRTVKTIGDLKEEHESEFYRALTPYMLRRTKEECLPWLPPKQHIEVMCDMGPGQKSQYEEFARIAEVIIDEQVLSATSILAEYTRLKQFAIALQKIEYYEEDGETKIRPIPTEDSCKLDALEENLDERGYFEGKDPKEQVVIASQFSSVVRMVHGWLTEKKKVNAVMLTGDTNKKGERKQIQDDFQSGVGPKIIVMTTQAGGVSINLDMADSIHFMDETWEPDDQEQAADRIHRASRNHQVTCYYYRTRDTIEEYIKMMNVDKGSVNRSILDLRRQGLRAIMNKD